MDDIEMMVAETFRLAGQQEAIHVDEVKAPIVEDSETEEGLPRGPGILYHVQKSTSIFVVRTLVSQNICADYHKVLEAPEEYPTLRLLENEAHLVANRLRYFTVDTHYQAEIIHDQLNNRRFPIFEETLCNLSDPGFSWWLTRKDDGFQVSFNLSVSLGDKTVKLGPLGDHELALRNFQELANLISVTGLPVDVQAETNRVQFVETEPLILEELQDLLEFGVIGKGVTDLFKLMALRNKKNSSIETAWFYLQELAAIRRFWIQIQYDLN